MSTLEERIKEFADWNDHTAKIYSDAAKKLMKRTMKPMTEDQAVEFLERLYNAAASDFGN